MKSINPYTSEVIAEYEPHSSRDINRMLDTLSLAQGSWRRRSASYRASRLLTLADVITSKKESLAGLMVKEMGKPISQATAEIEKCAWLCRYYSKQAESFLTPEVIETDADYSAVHFEPLGVILGIMPWNFPFWQAFRFFVPALAAGNVCALKHASNVTGCALQMEDLLAEAGFDDHVFKVLKIGAEQVGEVISDPRIAGISLTGSEGAGRAVGKTAGRSVKPVVLELGGSNAFIVLKDADLPKAVEDAITGRFQNNGQSCIAAKRILVAKEISEQFTSAFADAIKSLWVGDPSDNECYVGPLARKDLAEDLHDQVERSIKMGARLAVGGTFQDATYAPTLLLDVKPGMPAFDEETFGPVACVTSFKTLEEAIELSNKSSFGLGVSIYTKDVDTIKKHIYEFREGAVFINSIVKSDPRLPFGGVKNSGVGRELGVEGIRSFVNRKTVFLKVK